MAKRVEGTRSPRWAFNKKMLIPCRDGIPYLFRRRVIQTPWFAIYLHDIFQPDTDSDPHDHPFPFASFIVSGNYVEKLWPNKHDLSSYRLQQHNRWSIHKMSKQACHRIVNIDANQPLRTLVFVGPRSGTWGFWTPTGFVPWMEYEDLLAKTT